jgi:hypothetical protein
MLGTPCLHYVPKLEAFSVYNFCSFLRTSLAGPMRYTAEFVGGVNVDTEEVTPSASSLWASPRSRPESIFTDEGIANAPAFVPGDFSPLADELVAPFMTPLSVEALSTPTQDK